MVSPPAHPGPLERSRDKKVAFLCRPDSSGRWQAVVANSHGLPAGISCPGRTVVCAGPSADLPVTQLERMMTKAVLAAGRRGRLTSWGAILPEYGISAEFPCYVVDKLRRGTEENAAYRNWAHLRDILDDDVACEAVIGATLDSFAAEAAEAGVELAYRFHWDGDIPTEAMAVAIARAMRARPQLHAWIYTRSLFALPHLADVENLIVYVSVDEANATAAQPYFVAHPRLLAAALAADAAGAAEVLERLNRRRAPICPVDSGRMPLVVAMNRRGRPAPGEDGMGACAACRMCIDGRKDVRFTLRKTSWEQRHPEDRKPVERVNFATEEEGFTHLFGRRSPALVERFQRIDDAIMGLGVDVRRWRKHYVSYLRDDRHVVSVSPRGTRLLLSFSIDLTAHALPPGCRDISNIGSVAPGTAEYSVEGDGDLAAIADLVRGTIHVLFDQAA